MNGNNLEELKNELTLCQERLDVVLSQSSARIWEYDIPARRMIQTESSQAVYGMEAIVEDAPRSLLERGLIHPDSRGDYTAMFDRLAAGEPKAGCTVRTRAPDGGYWWENISCTTIFDKSGAPVRAIAVSTDVSAQKDTERKYFQEEHMRSMLSEDVIAASKVNLTTGEVEYIWAANVAPEALERIRTYEQMYRVGLNSILTDEDKERYNEVFGYRQLLAGFSRGVSAPSLEYRYTKSGGKILWARMTASLVRNPGTGDIQFFSFIRDIDEKKKIELTLRKKAERDEITGLYNKATTQSMIAETIRQNSGGAGKCALMLLDVDDFKRINDTYGHPYGDYVLSEIGKLMLNTFGNRAILGRMGGDEFAAFVERVPSEHWLCQKAEELQAIIGNVYPEGKGASRLTGSIGIAVMDEKGADFPALYEQSDTALYEAKRNGKNSYAFYTSESARIAREDVPPGICIAKDHLGKHCMLDELEELIFIIDYENCDLLYANRAAQERLGLQQPFAGKKCYEVIQGLSERCVFCKCHLPNEQEFQVWEHSNQRLNSRFIVKDKAMRWHGRKIRFEMFLNAEQFEGLQIPPS